VCAEWLSGRAVLSENDVCFTHTRNTRCVRCSTRRRVRADRSNGRIMWQLAPGMSVRGHGLLWNPSAMFRAALFSPTGRVCRAKAKCAFVAWTMAIVGCIVMAMLGTAP
jgi:hypothetical protein